MMFEETYQHFFERSLFESLGKDKDVLDFHFISGGNVNSCVKLKTTGKAFFLKWNEGQDVEMFEKEAAGLELLRETGAIRIPEVIGYGCVEGKAYLLLEFIDSYAQSYDYWEDMGSSLAKIHSHTKATFGLDYDNYIGSLSQCNQQEEDGIKFYAEHRIKAQAGLAFYNNQISHRLLERVNSLCGKLADLLPQEKPALLHGDLWIGNIMTGRNGKATLIDPAVYYGLREAEIAFTRLFGGFDDKFYWAYQDAFPLVPGFSKRADLYNLYPLLVHVNLFGSGYVSGVEKIVNKYR
jgi:protein-ribulosamine 3-kinase